MKKIILFSIGMLVYLTLVVSCGPSAREMEETRLADSVRMATPAGVAANKEETLKYLDDVMNTTVYYQDVTTGVTYSVISVGDHLIINIVHTTVFNPKKFSSK